MMFLCGSLCLLQCLITIQGQLICCDVFDLGVENVYYCGLVTISIRYRMSPIPFRVDVISFVYL